MRYFLFAVLYTTIHYYYFIIDTKLLSCRWFCVTKMPWNVLENTNTYILNGRKLRIYYTGAFRPHQEHSLALINQPYNNYRQSVSLLATQTSSGIVHIIHYDAFLEEITKFPDLMSFILSYGSEQAFDYLVDKCIEHKRIHKRWESLF